MTVLSIGSGPGYVGMKLGALITGEQSVAFKMLQAIIKCNISSSTIE